MQIQKIKIDDLKHAEYNPRVDLNEYFTPQRTPVRFLKPPVHGKKPLVINI